MKWQEIKVNASGTHFVYEDRPLYRDKFCEVLKFHKPGLAAVRDDSGWFHINAGGDNVYAQKFERVFGFYEDKASVVQEGKWFHINPNGEQAYEKKYAFAGNFQYGYCVVRDIDGNYFHIDHDGERFYRENYRYAGDYKDCFACVMLASGYFKHIDREGKYLYESQFRDLGVFHKGFATARDKEGAFHIGMNGKEIYKERYFVVEPFYNGCALVETLERCKIIIDEKGRVVHRL
jgi:hypothetical protein